MSLENHPQLCNMSETLGRVGPDRNGRIDQLSRKVGRELADIEKTGDPAALIGAAKKVWETAAAWNLETSGQSRTRSPRASTSAAALITATPNSRQRPPASPRCKASVCCTIWWRPR